MRRINIILKALKQFKKQKWKFLSSDSEFKYYQLVPLNNLKFDQFKIFEYKLDDYILHDKLEINNNLKPWFYPKKTKLYNFNFYPLKQMTFKSHFPSILNTHNWIKDFDVKYIWEIARFQFIVPEMIKSENPKEFYFNNLTLFLSKNPIGFGFHWSVPMEISIRAINIYIGAQFLEDNYTLTSKEKQLINGYLGVSLEIILKNPEKTPGKRGNHYLTNLASIIILSCSKKGKENIICVAPYLLDFLKEINIQFFKDGSLYEGSSWYHLYSFEIIELIYRFLNFLEPDVKKNLISELSILQQKKYSTIEEILENFNIKNILFKGDIFRRSIIKPNGELHQIGDTDSGRYINLNTLGPDKQILKDYIYTNKIFRFKSGAKIKESSITLVNKKHNFKLNSFKEYQEFYFKDFGLYVRKNKFHYLGFRCGGNDSKRSHMHDDQMSIELNINQENVYTDPGTFRYNQNSNIRECFISGHSHNGYKRYKFLDKENIEYQKFNMPLLHFGEIIEISNDKVVGQIKTFDFIFYREIRFNENNINIIDSVNFNKDLNFSEDEIQIELTPKFISKHYGHYEENNSSMWDSLQC